MSIEITLLRDVVAAREKAAGKSELQEAMGEWKEGAVPSAPAMVEKTSREEELREQEGMGLRAELLPKPEAPAPPVLKAHPVVIKKVKIATPTGCSVGVAFPSPHCGALYVLPLYPG